MSWLTPSQAVLAGGLGVNVVVLAAVAAVDVLDLGGARQALASSDLDEPALWWHVYANGGLVEWVQWGLLAATALLAAATAGRDRVLRRPRAAAMWGLIGCAAVLMLIEDAGDPRHRLADLLETLLPDTRSWQTLAELIGDVVVFGVLALPAVLALAVLWRAGELPPWRASGGLVGRRSLRLLLGGYGFYAAAGLSSLASSVRVDGRGWYHALGDWVVEELLAGRLLVFRAELGFWVMDRPYEETLELLGATLLCAAVLAYRERTAGARDVARGAPRGAAQRRPDPAPPDPGAP